MLGWSIAVGWNCMNSTSATATPARSAIAMPSPVDTGGFVVTENSWPAPPVARMVCRARSSTGTPRGVERAHPDAPPALDDQIDREAALVDVDRRQRVRGVGQRPLDLGAGGVAARVHDPRQRVAALDRELEHAVARVELGAELHELADAPRSLGHQHVHGVDVAQPRARDQRVGLVERAGVGLVERGGDAALRVAGGRGRELALGDHADPEAGTGRRGSRPRDPRSHCPAPGDRSRPLTPLRGRPLGPRSAGGGTRSMGRGPSLRHGAEPTGSRLRGGPSATRTPRSASTPPGVTLRPRCR